MHDYCLRNARFFIANKFRMVGAPQLHDLVLVFYNVRVQLLDSELHNANGSDLMFCQLC